MHALIYVVEIAIFPLFGSENSSEIKAILTQEFVDGLELRALLRRRLNKSGRRIV